MKKVENAGKKGIARKRKPYQITPDDFFSETQVVKGLFGRLINVQDVSRVVTVPSVAYAMACVANNMPKKSGEIIVADAQFPSNVYPWKRLEKQGYKLRIITPPDDVQKGAAWNENIWEAINAKTALVALGHVHWADGTLFQLERFREKLDGVDGLLAIDGTQSVGAYPFDAQKIRPDVVVSAAYKWLMGPYSIGMAYFGEKFDHGTPVEEHWMNRADSEDFSKLIHYQEQYKPGATRYEVGEHSNFVLMPMLKASLQQVLRWKPENIQDYCENLIQPVVDASAELGLGMEHPAHRGHHLFGIKLNDRQSNQAMKIFRDKRVSVSLRGNYIRVSPHVYNDEIDVRRFISALRIIAGEN